MPELSDDLNYILNTFLICERQLRCDYGSIIGLDYNVVLRVAEDMGIITDHKFYRLLKAFENVLVTEVNKKSIEAIKANNKNVAIDGSSGKSIKSRRN